MLTRVKLIFYKGLSKILWQTTKFSLRLAWDAIMEEFEYY